MQSSVGKLEFLDGLRGIAVLAVVLYHFEFPVALGYLGVDIFFVISGFLIFMQISRISSMPRREAFLYFVRRRLARILPALSVTILATMAFALLLFTPVDMRELGITSVYATLGLSNLYFLVTSADYFGQDLHLNPLLHTWSLGIEEQWYALAGVFILLTLSGKGTIRKTSIILMTVTVLSALLFVEHFDSPETYFNPLARFWELGVGALTASFLVSAKDSRDTFRASSKYRYFFVMVVIYGCLTVLLVQPVPLPEILWVSHVLVVILVATIIYWGARHGSNLDLQRANGRNRFKLRSPLAYFGTVSYSLYLYHWPIWVFMIYRFDSSEIGIGVLQFYALALSAVLATLSYKFVERKFWSPSWRENES